MRIRSLTIREFGPFRQYQVTFPSESNACALLTGKNNEGKSTIIQAMKLVHAATRVVGKHRQRILIDHDVFYRLLQQDIEDLLVRRLVHNYADVTATIRAQFQDNFSIVVYVDPIENLIYA